MDNILSTMSYEELSTYMVICYYACDHRMSDQIMAEMKRRYPERYYEDLCKDD